MICHVFVLCAILGWLAPAQAGSIWKRYVNERFGATADHPADWSAGRAPENGDGLRFSSPDGEAYVSISGSLHTFETTAEVLDIVAQVEPGTKVTLQKRGPRSIVQSGVRGDRIFYKRSFLACKNQVWNNLVIEYPAARKQEFDPVVTHISASFKAGPGYQVECT